MTEQALTDIPFQNIFDEMNFRFVRQQNCYNKWGWSCEVLAGVWKQENQKSKSHCHEHWQWQHILCFLFPIILIAFHFWHHSFRLLFPAQSVRTCLLSPAPSMKAVLCTMTHTQQRKSLGLNLIYLRSQMCFIWARGCETWAQMIQLSSFDTTIKHGIMMAQ